MAEREDVLEQDAKDSADAERIFAYDPFETGMAGDAKDEPEKAAGPAEEKAGGAEAASEEAPVEEAPAEGEDAAAQAPAEPQAGLTAADLAAAGDALRRAVEGVTATQEKLHRQLTPQQEQAQQQQNQARYGLNITDEMLAMVTSQDPAQVRLALNTIVNGVANLLHNNIQTEYRAHVSEAVQSYYTKRSEDEGKRREVFDDFYGKYPTLNDPVLLPIVARVAKEEMTQLGDNVNWSPTLRDKIGTRVMQEIAVLAKKFSEPVAEGPQQAATAAAAALKKQTGPTKLPQRQGGPKQVGSSVRRGVAETPSRQAEDIADTLFGVG